MSVHPLTPIPSSLKPYFEQIKLPAPDSHKGQNGKLLIIGGSDLFHAASKWSLDVASKCVDMVFYSSIPENNELVKQAKGEFWNGIVVPRESLESYLEEADAVLIGPGMTRTEDTQTLTNHLLQKYPTKKWVLDAGALQMLDPDLITESMILTPHHGERELSQTAGALAKGATLLIKGQTDTIQHRDVQLQIMGGNAGMTKGGTGDVLAGLVAALYTQHEALTAAVVASFVNKRAGDLLFQEVGPYFNASDLVDAVPRALWQSMSELK